MKTCALRNLVALALMLAAAVGCSTHQRQATPPVPLPALDASVMLPGPDLEYRLQPGDGLRVKFLYHPELDIKVPVRPDGRITLQATGELVAAGLTANQLAEVIRERSSDRLRDPEVTVIVSELGEQKIYVGGEVKNPGFVAYRPGLTPLQAVLDRGGFTDTALTDSVVHIMVREKDYQAARLDLGKVLEGEPETEQLAAHDVLYVPRSTIGDMDSFVQLYVQRLLPMIPRVGYASP